MKTIPTELIRIWKDLEKKENALLKKHGLIPDDWFCDIWVSLSDKFFSKPDWNLPEDTIQIGGVGIQGDLDIYCSPSKGYLTGGMCSKSLKPTPVNPRELKTQIIEALKEDIRSAKKYNTEGVVDFQKDNIRMIQGMNFDYPFPKNFSVLSDTIYWAKKFTPRIPLGEKFKLFFLNSFTFPLTLLGAVVGLIKGLATKFKHYIKGTPTKEHQDSHKDDSKTKNFSDTPLDLDPKGLCKEIPGFEKLITLNILNNKLLLGAPEEFKDFIFKYFPSFLGLSSPEKIKFYREDFISKGGEDYAEILFTFGKELIFLWDFDRKKWSVQDWTYGKDKKEWWINEDILDSISSSFNPENNKLLKHRIEAFKAVGIDFDIEKYCQNILELIKYVKNK